MGKNEKQNCAEHQESVDIIKTEQVPEGGWGWLVCVAGFFAQFTILGIQNNTGILYTSLLTEFKGSKGDTGTLYDFIYSQMEISFFFAVITCGVGASSVPLFWSAILERNFGVKCDFDFFVSDEIF